MKLKFLFLVLLFIGLFGFTYFQYRHRSFLRIGDDHTWLLTQRSLGDDPINLVEDIPLFIHQTYVSKDKVPQKVLENISEYAPEFTRYFYDDNDIRKFLLEHFHGKVLDAFNSLKLGAHKADLFRYCILYIKGGVYLDIKTQLIQPLKPLIKLNS
jgi:mannosyltransferase OCH1-like enzyme